MNESIAAHIFQVFVNDKGEFGNPVGIVVDEKEIINTENRQKISSKLGFSESVFINDLTAGKVSIFNPTKEVKFAGHALIGTAYFISQVLGKQVGSLECKGGIVKFWQEDKLTWIRANLEGTPPWHHEQFKDSSSIDKLSVSEMATKEHVLVWAWIDENKGIVRARTFAADWGITEDQGNGSGSMQLAAILNRRLEIHHGEGSIIFAKPVENRFADVGGMVKVNPDRSIIKA